MAQDLSATLSAIDERLVHGSVTQARDELHKILGKKIERRFLVTVANLARRMHLPERSVALLYRVVRSERQLASPPTAAEKAEYAAALTVMGGSREAMQLLSGIDAAKHPVSLLFQAYAHIWQWDWNAALPYLERFVRCPGIAPDMHFWGLLNLAHCQMHGSLQLTEARERLDEVVAQTGLEHFRMLHKNALLGMLQNSVFRGDWSECRKLKVTIEKTCADDDPVFNLVFELWSCLALLYAAPQDPAALRALRRVRAHCLAARRWENMRACDFYEALLLRNEKLLVQLYFGTPFPAFQQRVLKTLGGAEKLPERLEWNFFQRIPREKTVLDVSNGANTLSTAFLKEGQVPQQLLQTLGTDFYRPMQVAELHERLYPGERFNPRSSPNRVHQAVSRLRHWFVENRLGLSIKEHEGYYELSGQPGFVLDVPRHAIGAQAAAEPTVNVLLQRKLAGLRKVFGKKAFKVRDVALRLETSYPSALRILTEALKFGLVRREGQGRLTHYFLNTDEAQSKAPAAAPKP